MTHQECQTPLPVQTTHATVERLVLLAIQTTLMQPLGKEAVINGMKQGLFRSQEYTQGSTIHFEGDVCQNLEIVLSGQVVIERIDAEGNLMTVAQGNRHEVLGGNLIFSQRPVYPMTLSAAKDTILLMISKKTLLDLLWQNQAFLKVYLELTSDRANSLGEQIRHYVNKPIRMCIVSYLKQEYGQQKTNPIKMSLSKKKFAEKIGVQRTSISRELAKMRSEGLIQYDRHVIKILDMSLLE